MVPRDIASGAWRRSSPRARRTSASSRDGRARRPDGSRDSTSSPIHRRPLIYTEADRARSRHGAMPLTASTSITPAIRAIGSITAAAPSASSAPRSRHACRRDATRRSMREKRVDLFAYPDAFPDRWRSFRVARTDRARATGCTRGEARAAGGAGERRGRARRCRRRSTSRLQDWGALAQGGSSSTRSARWPTRPSRRDSPNRSRRPRDRRRRVAVWAGIGAYRLSPRGNDRQHPDRAPARRRRRDPVFVRQPDQSAPGATGLPVASSAALRSRRRRRAGRIALMRIAAQADGPHLARLPRHRRLPAGDHRVRVLVRALPEDHARLLPHRPLGAVVGDLLHHRRHRNQHAELHRRARPARMPAT